MEKKPVRSLGYFEFLLLTSDGAVTGGPQRINTTAGLILNCPPFSDPYQIDRLAAIARKTPDYPVDITVWKGPKRARVMVWSARIYWRETQ